MALDITKIKVICFDIYGTLADTDDVMAKNVARFISLPASLFPPRTRLLFARKLLLAIESPANKVLLSS